MTANNFAVVTVGSTGIGAEICRQMLEAGYEVISLGANPLNRMRGCMR